MDVKRLAARVLKVGKSRIYFDKEHLKEIDEAITAKDIRRLIKQGYIKVKPSKKNLSIYSKLRKRKGPGSKKGSKYARFPKKERWMIKIRAQRRFLKELRDNEIIDKKLYRELYRKSKAGVFRSKAHIKIYFEKLGIELKKKKVVKKEERGEEKAVKKVRRVVKKKVVKKKVTKEKKEEKEKKTKAKKKK